MIIFLHVINLVALREHSGVGLKSSRVTRDPILNPKNHSEGKYIPNVDEALCRSYEERWSVSPKFSVD